MLQGGITQSHRVRPSEPAVPSKKSTRESLVRFIEGRCFGRVHGLEVELCDGRLILYGRTGTYYAKQLVQHAALEAGDGLDIDNRIEVLGRG